MRIRRTLLFIPGNNPAMLFNSTIFGADSIILDLEDAVAPGEKDAARMLVKSFMKNLDYDGVETIVRINSLQTSYWFKDLEDIIPLRPYAILLPKTQSKQDVYQLDSALNEIEKRYGFMGETKIIPLLESALGIELAYEIAGASKRVETLFLGAEDLTADLGAKRSKKGLEILFSRSRIVIAARAAGITAIDTPFTDANDDEGLVEDAVLARELGFSGKAVISPRHIDQVNKVFSPSPREIEYAQRVIAAIESAEKEGKGVISLDGKMIDAPIVARARQVLATVDGIKGGKGNA